MNIKLTHRFLLTCHDLPGLLAGCNKLSTFCSRLEKQAQTFPDRYAPNSYKGDGLELFTEALIKLSPMDARIGIRGYEPNTKLDVGVDGTGVGMNGKPATVQVKYRGYGAAMLTANEDHLSNFVSASLLHEGVDRDDKYNMLIVTTAPGLHFFTDQEMFAGKVRCLGKDQLRELVDDNIMFWRAFRDLCCVPNV
jgi:hypothetical protein